MSIIKNVMTASFQNALVPKMSYRDFIYPIISEVDLGIIVYSPAFIIEWANDYIKDLFPGINLEGNPCYSQFYQRSEPCEDCIVHNVFKSGKPAEKEIYLTKNRHWYLEKAYPIKDEKGHIQYVFETIQDITAAKEYQKAILDNEKKYREMINLLPQVYFEVNFKGQITESNLYAMKKFGYDQNDIDKRINIAEIIHPDDRRIAFLRLQRLLKSPNRYRVGNVYRLINRHGKSFYGSIYTSVKKEKDKPTGYRGIIVDVDERVKMERMLKASEAKYRSVVEESNDGILLIQNEQFKYANPAILELFGFRNENELLEKNIYEFIAPSSREFMKKTHRERSEGKDSPSKYEAEILNTKGVPIPVEISVVMITVNDNPMALTFVRDLREQKEAERKIQESVSDFQMVISQISDVFWKIEINRDKKVMDYFLSPSFETVFGLKREDMEKNFMGLVGRIHAEDRSDFIKNMNRIRKAEIYEFYYEYRITKEYGIYSWFVNKGKVQKRSDGSIIAFGISSDVDRQKKMELDSQKAKERAEEAAEVKSRFLANMSHEIRTPLNSIIGMTDLAYSTDSLQEQQNYLGRIKESTNHLLGVINQILDFSKIDSGKISVEMIPFNLKSMLDTVLDNAAASKREKNIDIDYHLAENVPSTIISDPVKIRQILTNLLDNAKKFTSEGSIELKVEADYFSERMANIRFTIKDTGIGIKPEQLKKIFESFHQAENSIYRTYGGTGLGLSITKAYVELLNGKIDVHSEYGKGAQFSFYIPVQVLEAAQLYEGKSDPQQKPKLEKSDNPLKILLAEDNEDNINLIGLVLNKTGHDFDIVVNGEEAISMLKENVYDIILMDIEMPVKNGLQAAREIRNGNCGMNESKIPIIALTAHVIPEVKEKCNEAGMDGYIEKPLNIFSLNEKIQKVVQKI